MLKIYTCVFFSKYYLEEAKICIKSLRTNGKYSGVIYVFTDLDGVDIDGAKIIKTTCDSIANSSAFRLNVFKYLEFEPNDIILYLDTDIVTLKPVPNFEQLDDKVNVYGYDGTFGFNNRKQNGISFAGYLTNDQYVLEQNAFCAGILLFRPTQKIKDLFAETIILHAENVNKGKINSCWEQPSLCLILAKNDMFNITLNEIVMEERTHKKISDKNIFNHFCGMRGHTRYELMKKYLN